MSYLVLARKYRPQTFADMVGQEPIIKTLERAFESGRIAHAFLLTGSRGVGKTTIARVIAKALICEKGISTEPCLSCANCKEVAAGTALDVIEIDGASNTGVDDIRELKESIRYQPARARFKVVIIDEVHMLSNSAFNALLKTLEEPPPHAKFVLATTEPHKIPATILSRCQRYDFKRYSMQSIRQHIEHVLQQEHASLQSDVIKLIAQASEGCMRDALSLTDQVLSFAEDNASVESVRRVLGVLDASRILHIVQSICDADTKSALQIVNETHESGMDLKNLMEQVATFLRHLCISSQLGTIAGMADLAPEDVRLIDEIAAKQEALDVQRLFAMALAGIEHVAASTDTKLAMELCFMRMCTRPKIADTITISNALARLEALGKNIQFPEQASPSQSSSSQSSQASPTYESPIHARERKREEIRAVVEEDPMVKKALEMFGGEIKSIKNLSPNELSSVDAK